MRRVLALATAAATVLAILATSPAHAAPRHPLAWGAIGDSITAGLHASSPRRAYPAVAHVPSIGRSGQGLVSGPFWAPLVSSFGAEVDQLKASDRVNAVVVEIGVNDLTQGLTDQVLTDAYRQLVRTGPALGVRVVLATITPVGPGWFNPAQEQQRERLNRWIRAQGPFVDFALALGGDQLAPAYDSGDGLHPSDAGQARLAHTLTWFTAHVTPRPHVVVCVRSCPPPGPRPR